MSSKDRLIPLFGFTSLVVVVGLAGLSGVLLAGLIAAAICWPQVKAYVAALREDVKRRL